MKRLQAPLAIYSSTGLLERMLAATGFTPLLGNLESMTSKLKTGVGSKICVALKVEKAVHYFVHTGKATTDTSTD